MQKIILKIGGSVITKKDDNLLEAKIEIIRRVAREIKKAKEEKDFKLILVHGAGPFGHKLVSEYGIKDGIKTEKHIEGFVRTHNSMEDLNKIIADVFREESLLGFPIQPSACVVQENKKIVKFDTEIIQKLFEIGDVIPIMYGDFVVDRKIKGSVISGDAIITYLANALKAEQVLMGTDVDGIFTADPKLNQKAELIEKIDSKNFDKVLDKIKAANTVDVTGGMRGKILEIKENLKGLKTTIFNLNVENNLYRLLSGKKIRSTEIEF